MKYFANPDFIFAIQPFGVIPRWVLEFIAETITTEFSAPCRILLPTLIPKRACKDEPLKYNFTDMRTFFLHVVPDRASRIIGVLSDGDLYTAGSDIPCQGAASLVCGTAAITLWHHTDQALDIPEGLAKFKRNLRRLVLHELGHTFANSHCPEAYCLMNAERLYLYENPAFCKKCRERISHGLKAGPAAFRFGLGFQFYGEKNYLRAAKFFRQAAKLSPAKSDYWLYLGCAYRQLGKFWRAKRCFNKHLRCSL